MRVFHAYLNSFRLLRFNINCFPGPLPEGPCVIIANHPTLIDVTALLSLYPGLCCVAKSELFRNPLVGRVVRTCDYISSQRGGPMSGASVVLSGLDRLRRGEKVMIFPEGTRSPLQGLHPFQRGAFEMAVRADVPVVCFWIRCTPRTLHPDLPLLSSRWGASTYTVDQLPVAEPSSWCGDAKAMARDVQAQYDALP